MSKDITKQIIDAKSAAIRLSALDNDTKNKALRAMADALDDNRDKILEANAEDMEAAELLVKAGELTKAMVDRLYVDDKKISGMIAGIEDIASFEDPVGETMSAIKLDDGLTLFQVRCLRPNVPTS